MTKYRIIKEYDVRYGKYYYIIQKQEVIKFLFWKSFRWSYVYLYPKLEDAEQFLKDLLKKKFDTTVIKEIEI